MWEVPPGLPILALVEFPTAPENGDRLVGLMDIAGASAPRPAPKSQRPENAPLRVTLAAPRPTGRGGASWKERVTMDWRHRAECLNHDPELFFPIGNTGPAITQIQEAKAVCQGCDVMTACLKFALETGQDSGVWGGLSEDERRSLKRRNARARRAS